jgi:hypothetical protein
VNSNCRYRFLNCQTTASCYSLRTPQFDEANLELELKPIIEKDFGRVSLILNPVFEKPLYGRGHDQGFEFGYRNGVYYRWMRYLSPGVEF